MIEEDFYATIKLKTGEEIFCIAAAIEEEDRTLLIISNPIVVSELKAKSNVVGYKVEPWLKTTTENMFIIKLDDVLTLSESSDIEMVELHQSYLRQMDKMSNNYSKLTKEMGYVSSVDDAKKTLENLYNNY
ncbi:MAG: hypothetical protein SCG72_02645 [Nitrosarchaeum sp.]|jgi:hypothetical protein|nr:hypothetical protein [Nitrosarchaeum sp.]